MTELTLESLAKRVETLEKLAAEQRAAPVVNMDWLKVVGMFDSDPAFMQQVIAEGQAIREAERHAAKESRNDPT
ncbi:unnamed protein product [Gemmata massiliana]|uniref:Uncharacterized protein n=1 Tax=Gemmata massiliana TaxID=1210884 RepID=A0A6P2CSC0_9BACT|nr:hypothetical protein [Gemmata massiliana]VTR91507.1 unnamed protein product [Gemmata massiliana]